LPNNAFENSGTSSRVQEYFSERKPSWNIAIVWELFRQVIGFGKMPMPRIVVRHFESQIQNEWPVGENRNSGYANERPKIAKDAELSCDTEINCKLYCHYAWANRLANLYGDKYQSAYILAYLLIALAVFIALLPVGSNSNGSRAATCIAVDFFILVLVFCVARWCRVRHWHDRWLEYLLLAELIRQLRFLAPLSGVRPLPSIPAHIAIYGDPTQTWMYWHMRALGRQMGIPNAKVTSRYVADCLESLAGIVGSKHAGQWGHHIASERLSSRIDRRLNLASFILLAAAIVAVVSRLSMQFMPDGMNLVPIETDRWFVLLSATLPALGAALAGINSQGQFARFAKRSAVMANGFEKYALKINSLRKKVEIVGVTIKLSDVIPLSTKIAETMVQDVADWRASPFFMDRP
jgi:hypothetical protein